MKQEKIISDDTPFEKEIQNVINKFSMENWSNTPDWILANYLKDCLNAFNEATRKRDNWYGGKNSGLDREINTKW